MSLWKRLLLPRQLRLLCASGFILFAWSGTLVWQEWLDYSNLVETRAFILDAQVAKVIEIGHDGETPRYFPEVRFRYLAGTLPYESTSVTRFDEKGDQAWAQELVARFPVDSETSCFYSPDHPDAAFLLKDFDFKHAIACAFGFLLCGLTLPLILKPKPDPL